MLFMVFIFYFLHLPANKGASETNSVLQTPAFIIKRTGESVDSGINCSHKMTNYDVILWYKQDQHKALKLLGYLNMKILNLEDDVKGKISLDGDGRTHSSLTISALVLNDSGVYFCAASQQGATQPAYFGQGTKLTVLERDPIPPKVKVLKPSPKECRNKNKTLVCVASKFYPDHVSVSWKLNGENINKSVATDNNALKQDDGSYTITSRLRVSAEKWYTPDNNFTCTVHFNSWNHTVDESASVSGVEAPGGRNITRDHYLRVTNAAKLSYGVFIARSCIYGAFVAFLVWKLQGSTGKQNN